MFQINFILLVEYTVTVTTGNKLGAGTDRFVFFFKLQNSKFLIFNKINVAKCS